MSVLGKIVGGLFLLFVAFCIGATVGDTTARNELTQKNTEASAQLNQAIAERDKSLAELRGVHEDLIAKWNQQQNDIGAGKYTRTQYVQSPNYSSIFPKTTRCETRDSYYTNGGFTTTCQ
jgi:hypothetical protein